MSRLFKTESDLTLTALRLVLGAVFFAHGAQKVLGWFGGYGFSATLGAFTHQMGIPAAFAVLAIAAEFLGGIGLVAGFFSRVAALGIAIEMGVAVALVHFQNGFFMNWYGNQKGEGFEYHLLAIALAVAVLVKGAGAFSLDRVVERVWAESRTQAKSIRAAGFYA
jgi:putative oxidoreductase